MRIGVAFPQTEIGSDPAATRDYVQAAEDLGYSHLFIADHVLGADPQFHQEAVQHERLFTVYTHKSILHECFTLMGYISAITKRMELVTGILILPQRQTALVAKQAAEVDVLSGGRLRIGVGVGWNHVEYEAMGQDFHTRGQRMEEQITVLRSLWTQEVINFHGHWHHITHAGLNPLPVQRPIPVWIGAGGSASPIPSDRVLRRIGRLADGWFPLLMSAPDEKWRHTVARLHGYIQEAGRNPNAFGIEGRVKLADKQPEDWVRAVRAWEAIGATHLAVETRWGGLHSPTEHINAIRRFKEAING